LLQIASVIGRRVPMRLLELACEEPERLTERLAECTQREFLYEEIIHGEPVYVFKHALVHQVAYESLSPTDQEAVRRAIGLAG
jgi:predicted ATPase